MDPPRFPEPICEVVATDGSYTMRFESIFYRCISLQEMVAFVLRTARSNLRLAKVSWDRLVCRLRLSLKVIKIHEYPHIPF